MEDLIKILEKNIKNFKKNGINVLHSLSEHQLTQMLKLANILYRNFQPIMTDNEYDIIQDYITDKYPSNQEVFQIGAPVEKNKAQLPYEMGSMDKIKPDTVFHCAATPHEGFSIFSPSHITKNIFELDFMKFTYFALSLGDFSLFHNQTFVKCPIFFKVFRDRYDRIFELIKKLVQFMLNQLIQKKQC